MRSFAQNIQVEVFSNKLYCWKDGGKVSDFLWFLVHSFCDTLDFDVEGFVHWSLRSLVVDASVDPPVLHFDPERNDDDDVKIPESVSSMLPNVHPQFQVPSYPSERTCKEPRNEIGRPSEDSHVSSVIDCVCVNKT